MPRGTFRRLRRDLKTILAKGETPSVVQMAVIYSLTYFIEENVSLARGERAELLQLIRSIHDDLFGQALAPGLKLKAHLLMSMS